MQIWYPESKILPWLNIAREVKQEWQSLFLVENKLSEALFNTDQWLIFWKNWGIWGLCQETATKGKKLGVFCLNMESW